MIELYVLRQFAAFAEAGTLSEAAEVLHLSQPALSRNMKKLSGPRAELKYNVISLAELPA